MELLYNYLLTIPPTETFVAVNQVWLTCVHPQTLVNKHNEFVHGNLLQQ